MSTTSPAASIRVAAPTAAVATAAPALVTRTVGLVEAMREAGLAVSVAETVDAVASLGIVDLADREGLRSALAATTVKNAGHRPAFDALFDLWFPPTLGEASADDAGEALAGDGAQADGCTGADGAEVDGRTGADRGPASTSAAAVEMTEAERRALRAAMREQLAAMLRADDRVGQRRLARDAVGRLGRAAGAGGSTSYSAAKTLGELSPETLLASLAAALRGDEPLGGMAGAVARRTAAGRIAGFERYVRDEATRRLAQAKGAGHVARTVVAPLMERVDFMYANHEELDALRRTVEPIARKLATKLTARRHHGRSGRLDFRRTVRSSLATGGVPAEPHFRPKRPHKPELVVLCDVSESVAAFASFTLQLTYALSQQFTRVRSFAFIDTADEITAYLEGTNDLPTALERIAADADLVRVDGHSDYGHALETFRGEFPGAVTSRTSLLILGDARSNYRDNRADILADLVTTARHAFWLNPEQRGAWGSGDSVAHTYRDLIEMVECRNVEQLTAFVERILPR